MHVDTQRQVSLTSARRWQKLEQWRPRRWQDLVESQCHHQRCRGRFWHNGKSISPLNPTSRPWVSIPVLENGGGVKFVLDLNRQGNDPNIISYQYIHASIHSYIHACMHTYTYTIYIYIYVCVYIYIYGGISKFLYPDSDEKHFHCVFTGLRLISSIAPKSLKIWGKTCE